MFGKKRRISVTTGRVLGAPGSGLPSRRVTTKWSVLRARQQPGPSGGRHILEREYVCSSMIIDASLSSAVRPVSRPLAAPIPYLDLSASGGTGPADQDESVEDSAVGRPNVPPSLLPPPSGPSPPGHIRSPSELQGTVQSKMSSREAPSTVRTSEAVIKSMAPRVAEKMGSPVLPMETAKAFFAFFGAAVLLGPKTPPPTACQLAARWNYVKLVKAAVAFWRAARCSRAIFDVEWAPRMGALRAGISRSCVHVSQEKPPLPLGEMRTPREKGATSLYVSDAK